MTVGSDQDVVLVTGASGYIAGHCIRDLLEHGYRVRGTVRSLADPAKVAHLRAMAETLPGTLEFVEADLEADDGWDQAVKGCTYVMHVASPNPPSIPRHEEDLIRPAVEGTLRLLRACAEAPSVKRVVLTSSIVAIIFGDDRDDVMRTEEDWSDPDQCAAYAKSKTLAERAAWDFVNGLPAQRGLELAVINPGFVLGPVLRAESNTSIEGIRRLLARQTPGSPRIGFATVDVRDTAVLHRLAMERPEAAGNRYLCAGEHVWMQDIAKVLAEEFNPQGFRVPTGRVPYWLMWVIGRFDKTVRLALGFIGRRELVTAEKAVRELGWTMRPVRQSIVDTARSLIEYGVVRARSGPRPRPVA
jgi:nucleoside-diphosphate-sugar epimerase